MMQPWLKKYLSNEDLKRIEEKIAQVEKKTSGEIVPMIIFKSSTVGHIPLIIYSLGILLYYISGAPELLAEYFEYSWWYIFAWALLLMPLTRMLSKLEFIYRVFVSPLDRQSQVEQRAMNEFYKAGLNKTDGSTGVLLFVSILDHQALVLADKTISEKLDSKVWQEVVSLLIQGIRSKNMADGFCKAIEKCGEILAPHFPIQKSDKNELSNKLVILED